tara:strand:- start:1463 stop:1576 length:114 start_codon:yes stop_codon:yes gene_type:complete
MEVGISTFLQDENMIEMKIVKKRKSRIKLIFMQFSYL